MAVAAPAVDLSAVVGAGPAAAADLPEIVTPEAAPGKLHPNHMHMSLCKCVRVGSLERNYGLA